MLEQIGHVLYHVLIVLFPVLLYYLIVIQKNISYNKIHRAKLLGLIILILILTMSFPVQYANSFNYDFRIIPIIIAFLYVGLLPGVITTLILLLYLYLLGETTFLTSIMNYIVVTIILFLLKKKYHSFALNRKLLIISILYWIIAFTRSVSLIKNDHFEQLPIMIVFSAITWITLLLVILLIENLKQQMLLQKELKRSEKLNVISQLAASVAHEVRNPLTTINGFLQLIRTEYNITDQQRSYINISLEELNRAQSIINDYLSLARPNNTDSQMVNISEELKKTMELMTSYTNIQNIEVETSIEDSLLIRGNKDEIKQVLINILKNAIEAIGSNGLLQVNAFTMNQKVMIEIIDDGSGMTKEQLSRIGTPFYSTKDKGTGIGLTISFQIIEQLKGSIEIKSEIGKGTTFLINLPVYIPNQNLR